MARRAAKGQVSAMQATSYGAQCWRPIKLYGVLWTKIATRQRKGKLPVGCFDPIDGLNHAGDKRIPLEVFATAATN